LSTAAKLGWEGIISKRADAPYRSERSEAWLKIKTSQRGKLPVIGFVKDPTVSPHGMVSDGLQPNP
jgi:bifunctional non-homologous end joining protein LigD